MPIRFPTDDGPGLTLRDFLDRFPEVVEERDGFVVHCPAHDDGSPSLRVTVSEDGKILLHCRAGCPKDDVLDALGITYADLRDAGDVEGIPTTAAAAAPPVGPAEVAALRRYVLEAAERLQAQDSPDAVQAAEYLARRWGVDLDLARALGLGVDPGGRFFTFDRRGTPYLRVPRVVVPFKGPDGVWRGAQGRDLTGRDPVKWASLSGSGWSRLGVFEGGAGLSTVLICEGPGDALTAAAAGYDAVGIRGASLAASDDVAADLLPVLAGRPAVLCGDADPAGNTFNAALANALHDQGVDVRVLDLPADVGDLTDWREADPDAFPERLHPAVTAARPWTPEPKAAAAPPPEQRYPLTDLGNAERLRDAYAGNARYVPEIGFYLFDGAVWREDHFDGVYTAAADVARSMASTPCVNTRATSGPQRCGSCGACAVASWGLRSQSRRALEDMVALFRRLPGIPLTVEDLDAHDHLLAVANGVVDLRTGDLLPHDRSLFITKRVAWEYRPDAEAPTWERFLQDVFPDAPELPDYMRRLVGYGITGSTAEQCFAVLWGTGSNGKSVFTDTLTHVFREHTVTTPFSTFEARPSAGIPNDIAALKGARLVMASEGEHGAQMAEAVIKRVTGRDLITARFMRKEFFEFRPTFLIFLATNYRPAFRGQDEGLWRRVKLIPWTRYFAPEERDHYLGDKLRAEAEGILAWAVRGAVEWYRNGLQDPPVVVEATKGYRERSNKLDGFLPGILELDPDGCVLGSEAYRLYREWADEEGILIRETWGRNTFYGAMEERGIDRRRTRQGMMLYGVRVAKPSSSRAPKSEGEIPRNGTHNKGVTLTDTFPEEGTDQ